MILLSITIRNCFLYQSKIAFYINQKLHMDLSVIKLTSVNCTLKIIMIVKKLESVNTGSCPIGTLLYHNALNVLFVLEFAFVFLILFELQEVHRGQSFQSLLQVVAYNAMWPGYCLTLVKANGLPIRKSLRS